MLPFEVGGTLWNREGLVVGAVRSVDYENDLITVQFFDKVDEDRLSTSTLRTMGVTGIEGRATYGVDHPAHYNQGSIEVIDMIRASLTPEEFDGFCKGNILKYTMRERYKGGTQDLEKAKKYMEWLIERKPTPDN